MEKQEILRDRIKKWRSEKNDFTLMQAKELLGFSIGYISDLENGNYEITSPVYRAYHKADPDMFPLSDAGLLI